MTRTLPSALAGADDRSDTIRRFEQRRVQAEVRARLFGATADAVTVDRFEVRRKLGEGAMGVAYAAHDPQLQREVALKLLDVRTQGEAQAALQEARALARVSHPNVLTVHEAGLHEGIAYIVSELVTGGTLREWIAADAGRRSPKVALPVLVAVARGVAAAHQRGIAHRDLKPDNVLVGSDGRPRVADFGLAITSPPSPAVAGAGIATGRPLPGTVAYMAPEQLRGDRADPMSDQFAFSVMAFEILFGKVPFEGASPGDLLRAIEGGAIAQVPGTPAARKLLPILRRGLAVDPGARWPSMDELARALERHGRVSRAVVLGAIAVVLIAPPAVGAYVYWDDGEQQRHVDHAVALNLQQRFDDCADYLAKHAHDDGSVQLWIGCAEASKDPNKLERACAAFPKRTSMPLPATCGATIQRARALHRAGRHQECFDTIVAAPPSPPGVIVLARCMGGLPNDEGRARRMCAYMESTKPPNQRTANCNAGVKTIK
jgi:hypothetical protein